MRQPKNKFEKRLDKIGRVRLECNREKKVERMAAWIPWILFFFATLPLVWILAALLALLTEPETELLARIKKGLK